VLASPTVTAAARETIGRYELLLELGRGGMAVLHLARVQGAGGFSKLFAIKQILPHLAADPPFVDMFLNEARIAARLSHPNLCSVFELGQERGELFLVMEYLDGVPWEALAAAMPRDARGLQLTAGVLAQACEGLHYAHTFRDADGTAMPIVHRDVSPQNVFVSTDGVCRVLDFGVSKIATDHRRTRTGVLKGKVPYMAPEQLRGEPVDGRADVWAVGVMLWEALVGRRLFDRDTDFLIYEAITGEAIPSVNAEGARYPDAIDGVIARALARDREARYATARELGRDLQRVAAEPGGAASREQIAGVVGQLCGDQISARTRAIASAVTRHAPPRPGDPEAPGLGGPEALDDAARGRTVASRDAAATLSMAMRKGSIIVERPRRRRWPIVMLGLAALAAGVAVVTATRGSSEPVRNVTASPGDLAAPSPTPGSAEPARVATAPASATSAVTAPRGRSASTAGTHVSPGTMVIGRATRGRPAPASATPAPAGAPSAASTTGGGSAVPPGGRTSVDAAIVRGAGSAAPHPQRDRTARDTTAGSDRPAASVQPGWYAIDSTPYATIFIDDRKIGDTPLDRISLAAGAHRVRAVLADGRQRTFAIDIAPDRKTSSGTLTW
jgi:eukaryotic-like serine/threonine-protein kinase